MKAAEGAVWLLLFIAQIVCSPLVPVLLYKFVAEYGGYYLSYVGFFRTLLFIQVIPFLCGLGILLYTIFSRYTDVNVGPYYMRHRQVATLALLSVVSAISDYVALISYTSISSFTEGLDFRLPFYLCMKLALTPIMAHIFGVWVLKRFFVPKSIFYFLVSLFGIFVYEFTIFDKGVGATSYSVSASILGGFKLMIPTIYTYSYKDATGDQSVYFFQWLPHLMVFLSCVCNALVPVLSKSFMIKHAHGLKLQQYQLQKTKLKDGQLNV